MCKIESRVGSHTSNLIKSNFVIHIHKIIQLIVLSMIAFHATSIKITMYFSEFAQGFSTIPDMNSTCGFKRLFKYE